MWHISDYSNSWLNENFSLTFRSVAHSFQMKKKISFHSSNLSPEKLKEKMTNRTRISFKPAYRVENYAIVGD